MEIFNVLRDPILPVSAIAILGFFLGKSGKMSVTEARLINRLAMTVFLPLLLFGLLANAPIHTFGLAQILTYLGVEMLVFSLGFVLARHVFKRAADESVLLAFCGIFANNAFFVLPISMLLYGTDNVLPIMSIIALDSTVTFAGTMIVLQMFQSGNVAPKQIALGIVKTPLLQAIVLGIFFALLQIPVPATLQTFVDFNGAAAAPAALFSFGLVMSQTKFRLDAVLAVFTGIKLILFPLAIWIGLSAFAQTAPDKALFIFGAAGPSGTMAFSLALLYGVKTDTIALIVIWTSLLTLFTLAALA